ncbi:MAG: glycosyltransferase family 4 protein [Ruminococcaceae bacterium]|nr:glycosyltransferase family 4 protein [Oscillospiraceae bacterium]
MKMLFFVACMERPGPSWHLMKALMEDTLASGIEIHAVQRHYKNATMPPVPDSILKYDNFSFSQVLCKPVEKKAFVKRYLDGIKYSFGQRREMKKHNDYDMIFMQSSPTSFYTLLFARHFAKNRPIIFNSQDMFPGSAIANGSMPNKWMQKIFYAMQRYAYRKVSHFIVISEDMKVKMMEQGVPEEKITVVVNWYDDAAVKEVPWEENRFVKQEGMSKDKFYVQYAGTMGTNFNPDIILDVAERLKDHKDIVFQMIGDGVRRAKFERDAAERGLDNIVFLPLQPQDMVSDVYSACSVCLIPLKRGVIGNSVPSKAGLLMACRRVIVNSVDEDSDYGKMFEREKIGFSAGITDGEKIARDILYLYENPDIREEYANRAKAYGEAEYSRTVNTKKYIELFDKLSKTR